MTVDALASQRSSVRGFRPEPVPEAVLRGVFATAQRAPSWCNIQPWRAVVTVPPRTAKVASHLVAAATSGLPAPEVPWPTDYPEPYAAHRRACGGALYQAMGVARDDHAGRRAAWLRNYELFDAPHLAVVSVARRLGPYAVLDVGVWLGFLMLAATEAGIDTCAMASVAAYPRALRDVLPIGDDDQILFGVVLGFRDDAVAANRARTTRAPLADNVTFVT